ncbi:cystathionine beta-lyase [Phenylobacterium montanum]|uniref:Cystathionine beta-lyase n=1 Tax=Phenylobacterium montanum TaxID=2823693 RepID=A0A975IVK4_9CAUL|nr:cystathionine beta-lyase [Caulobacter sp. S6]QUD87421.1 cystathionine beta-lyase [Caulobacter sp. S6]
MHWKTRLIHTAAAAPAGFRSLTPAIERGSTVVFASQADARDDWRQDRNGYTYGLYGTPTVLELSARIAELEGARHSFIVPGGQAAIALTYLAYCKAGGHALLPWAAYGPNQDMARDFLSGLGIEVELYDPMIGAGIAALIRPNTALIWTESPGSVTMEVQDVPAIAAAAHARGVPVALDNTYAAGVMFDAFAHGVDVSVQALTKYVGGHSDLLLGSVSVRDEATYEAVGAAAKMLGMAVSPDDAALALRGLLTLGVRLERLEASANAVAGWLAGRQEIETVLHPPRSSCPGHEIWRRDFTGSASVFSIVFDRRFSPRQVERFADRLRLFKAGYSWGGVTSLVMTYPDLQRPGLDYAGRIVRLNIGLEAPEDLIADLDQALEALGEPE